MNRSLSILLLSLGLITTWAYASPKPDTSPQTKLKKYRIISTVGRITAWEPFGAGWVEVFPGNELWESTLVQIHKGGTFTFELASKEALRGIQGEAIQIKLGTPIVVRLNENITRQVDLGSYFIPNIPKSAANPEDAAKNPLYQSITEAWARFAAIATVRGMPSDGKIPDLNKQESALALRAKRLQLITPSDGSTHLVEKVPTEIRVQWEPISDPDATYEVRLWKLDQPRPGPLALTQIDHHFVTVPREGPYYIQVTTADGKYQSEPAQIFVSLPIAGRIAKKLQTVGLASLPIPLLLPPDGFMYMTKNLPVSIAFEWDLQIEGETEPAFKFKVTDMAGKTLIETPVAGRRFVARLGRPGKFKWSVSAMIPPTVNEKREKFIESATNVFEIRGLGVPESDPIAELFNGHKSAVLYLENGFERR